MQKVPKKNFHMVEYQRINDYDNVLDVIFDPNSYEIDEKKC